MSCSIHQDINIDVGSSIDMERKIEERITIITTLFAFMFVLFASISGVEIQKINKCEMSTEKSQVKTSEKKKKEHLQPYSGTLLILCSPFLEKEKRAASLRIFFLFFIFPLSHH